MNINITVIERYIRLFSAPVSLIAIGFVAALVIPDVSAMRGGPIAVLKPMMNIVRWVSLLIGLFGSAWFAWVGWQLARWESGSMTGDCHSCGGLMSQLNGRYGKYRKCPYCGSKRQGRA